MTEENLQRGIAIRSEIKKLEERQEDLKSFYAKVQAAEDKNVWISSGNASIQVGKAGFLDYLEQEEKMCFYNISELKNEFETL